MTQEQFKEIQQNFSQYERKEVLFYGFIPSANKYTNKIGILLSIGEGVNR